MLDLTMVLQKSPAMPNAQPPIGILHSYTIASFIHSSPTVPCCAIISAVSSVIFRLRSATLASRSVLSSATTSALSFPFLLLTEWVWGPGQSGLSITVNWPECVFEFARSERKGRCRLLDTLIEPVNFPVPGPIDRKGLAVP